MSAAVAGQRAKRFISPGHKKYITTIQPRRQQKQESPVRLQTGKPGTAAAVPG